MILYLLKSAMCLLATLLFYKGVLERQNLPQFNRFYLLGSLLFALTAPLVPVEPETLGLSVAPIQLPEVISVPQDFAVQPTSESVAVTPMHAHKTPVYGWGWLFGLVTILLLLRFGINVLRLLRLTRIHPTVRLHEATMVLLPTDVLPHTFGHYLFVSRSAYESHAIEPELFTHERAHIRQRHTLDILFVELLLTVGWFNPLLYLFKRAIQLNHEFLADRAVTAGHPSVAQYQRLLLSKLTSRPAFALTSTLTFQTTKQRFTMMTKHTSRLSAGMAMGSAVLLFAGLLTVVGSSTLAQVAPTPQAQPTQKTAPEPKPNSSRVPQLTVAEMEQRFGDKMVHLPVTKPGQRVEKKFSELTPEQKKLVRYLPPFERKPLTEAQLADWKNAKKFGVWIDDKRIQNKQLDTYKAQDFDHFFVSKLEKNAINYGKHYFQINLTTKQGYLDYLKESEQSPTLFLDTRRR